MAPARVGASPRGRGRPLSGRVPDPRPPTVPDPRTAPGGPRLASQGVLVFRVRTVLRAHQDGAQGQPGGVLRPGRHRDPHDPRPGLPRAVAPLFPAVSPHHHSGECAPRGRIPRGPAGPGGHRAQLRPRTSHRDRDGPAPRREMPRSPREGATCPDGRAGAPFRRACGPRGQGASGASNVARRPTRRPAPGDPPGAQPRSSCPPPRGRNPGQVRAGTPPPPGGPRRMATTTAW